MNEVLIRKAKKGDKDAFCRLMDENVQSMYKIAAAYLKNDEDVADAIQDTILSCYENLRSLRKNRYFKTWLIRILINKCKDVIQKNKLVTFMDQIPETPFHEEYETIECLQALEPLDSKYRLVVSPVIDGQVEGQFLDDNTYACIFRYDLVQATKDYTEYNEKYNEMTQQVMDEMGITQADLDDQTDEGYALLEEFINKLSERGGAYQKYIKEIDIPDTFNLHLDITKVRGLEADYEWSEADDENYGRDAGYYKYEGDWSFDIPVTVDDSRTEVLELNDTNDAGIGLKSVIRSPYELTVNELYKEGSNSDCFMVALDANGNTLPYNESTGNCNNFAIQDRDISTVDIYFLDYIQYMDELKGQQNFDNPTKEDGQKWKKLLEENAKYHKTLHFDSDNAKN